MLNSGKLIDHCVDAEEMKNISASSEREKITGYLSPPRLD